MVLENGWTVAYQTKKSEKTDGLSQIKKKIMQTSRTEATKPGGQTDSGEKETG